MDPAASRWNFLVGFAFNGFSLTNWPSWLKALVVSLSGRVENGSFRSLGPKVRSDKLAEELWYSSLGLYRSRNLLEILLEIGDFLERREDLEQHRDCVAVGITACSIIHANNRSWRFIQLDPKAPCAKPH